MRRLTISEIAYWLMGAGAVLVVLGIVAFDLATTPPNAPCRPRKRPAPLVARAGLELGGGLVRGPS